MCGIAGLLTFTATPEAELRGIAEDMTERLRLRGPDAGGVWTDPEAGCALGHRRLSIVDLSPNGSQPMVSADGRHVIVYNGEIYNSEELRRDLPDVSFRGSSDTETILEGCARWGVENTVRRLIGMFAFAIWDRKERRLSLVRDRLGIKPLYWSMADGRMVFGSEMKALLALPGFQPSLDPNALTTFFRHTYIPAPATIFADVHKLKPGHILTVEWDRSRQEHAFWSLRDVASEAINARAGSRNPDEVVDQLDSLLKDAVGRRMIADVPLGAFLSGGIDSSLIVGLMQAQSSRPVKTFTIGFEASEYDESSHAQAVARHLGTEHTEIRFQAKDALALVPSLAEWYDEPFADSSQLPTHLVSKLARDHVTVTLSGDGGDELFAGYDRYPWALKQWRALSAVPAPLRRAAHGMLGLLPAHPHSKAGKLRSLSACRDQDEVFRRIVTVWEEGDEPTWHRHGVPMAFDEPGLGRDFPDALDRMQYVDCMTHLSDDILTKVDRASMAISLEARVPLLDHRVVQFAFGLTPELRRLDGRGKWPLRQVLSRYVPAELWDRPKRGFMIPMGQWLRGELREWAEHLLSGLDSAEMLNPKPIRRRWQEHVSGRHDWTTHLWTVLMFLAWRERWMR